MDPDIGGDGTHRLGVGVQTSANLCFRGFTVGVKGQPRAAVWLSFRGRPEQDALAAVVKRRGGADVRVGCSGAAATCQSHRLSAELKCTTTGHS